MALFGNKTKATALFFVLVFLVYGGKQPNVERTRRAPSGAFGGFPGMGGSGGQPPAQTAGFGGGGSFN